MAKASATRASAKFTQTPVFNIKARFEKRAFLCHSVNYLKQMFRGTVTQTSVYPREVVKEALAVNAAAVVLAHNHPSGSVEPSRSDEFLTQTLKTALALVDVRVLDHLVVAGAEVRSFA